MNILGFIKMFIFGMARFYAGLFVLLLVVGGAMAVLPADFSGEPIEEPEVENEIVEKVNEVRAQNGAVAVSKNRGIQQQAEGHTSEMAEHDTVAHQIGVSTAESRLRAAGCGVGSENLAGGRASGSVETEDGTIQVDSAEDLAEVIVTGWVNSEGHFENMIDTQWRDTGVSVWITDDDEVYVTQMFCE